MLRKNISKENRKRQGSMVVYSTTGGLATQPLEATQKVSSIPPKPIKSIKPASSSKFSSGLKPAKSGELQKVEKSQKGGNSKENIRNMKSGNLKEKVEGSEGEGDMSLISLDVDKEEQKEGTQNQSQVKSK